MSTAFWKIRRWSGGRFEELSDEVVREEPLTLYVNGREVVTLLTLGGHPEELAVGFLRAEGFLSRRGDLLGLRAEEGAVRVEAAVDAALVERLLEKRTVTTGCGKGTTFYHPLDALRLRPLVPGGPLFSPDGILGRMRELEGRSEVFRRTGGVHNASLAEEGRTLLFRTDIGRHNAVDMLGGRAFLDGMPLGRAALLTTGRVSSEILLKAAKMGVPVLVSRSAPTELALRLADELGLTVAGYARAGRMNVYTHFDRIGG